MAYNFNYDNTYLQGDNIVVAIDPASDITSPTGKAKEYQYKIDSRFLKSNGDCNTNIDSSTGWKNISLSDNNISKIVVPTLEYDAYNTLYLRAADDARPEYVSIGQKEFYSFKQKTPQFLLSEVTENSATATILDLGFGYPQNGASIDYIKKVAEAFTNGDFEWVITLYRADNENAVKKGDRLTLGEVKIDLKNYSTNTLNFSFTQEGYQSTNLYFACEITSTLDRAVDDRNYIFAKGSKQYTNIYFVSANTVSFQIRSRSVRAQMPKVDEIGSASTGAGMFSNSNAIGYKDNSDSIALYSSKSTRVEQPSIGFYKTDHTKIADIYTKENGSIYGKMANGNEVDLLNPVAENAKTADKLKTARKIKLVHGATGEQIFDGSTDIDIPITSLDESCLNWGNNKSISGKASPIGAALSSELSANRLAYLKPEALAMEYSNDGGLTWEEASWADSAKIGLVTTSSSITIGSESTVTTNHRTRVMLTAQDGTTRSGYFYTRPRKLLVNVSDSGHGLSVTIESKTGVSDAKWKTVGTYALDGWSGWNDISISALTTLGGDSITQTGNNWYLRFTFAVTSVNSSYKTSKATVLGMRLFGDSCWTSTSNMGKTGHLYEYDTEQNAIFPAKVTAESFEGALSADEVKKALGVVSGETTKFLKGDGTWAVPSTGGSVDLNGYAMYSAGSTAQGRASKYAKYDIVGNLYYVDKIPANDIGGLPTINDATLTIQRNGTTAGTFSANASTNVTIDIEVPTGAAANKGIDTTISTTSPTNNNVPTSKAVASYLTDMGYLTLTNAVNHGVLTNTNLGYSENGKNYPVEKDSNGKLYVNVPWIEGETDLSDYIKDPGNGVTGYILSKTTSGYQWKEDVGAMLGTANLITRVGALESAGYITESDLSDYLTANGYLTSIDKYLGYLTPSTTPERLPVEQDAGKKLYVNLSNYTNKNDFNALVNRVEALEDALNSLTNANGVAF